jgi:hypothetical protein
MNAWQKPREILGALRDDAGSDAASDEIALILAPVDRIQSKG